MDQLHLESIADERLRERAALHLAAQARASMRRADWAGAPASRVRGLLSRLVPRRTVSAPNRKQRLAE
jgi:hypothetical protein